MLLDRFRLTSRRALVTGGSVSIGRAIAIALAEVGADVAVQSEPGADAAFGLPGAAADTVASVKRLGRRAGAVAADFARAGEARRTVADAAGLLGGPVDILVVCASVQSRADFLADGPDDVARQVSVNLLSTVELLQAALPSMLAAGWGRVLSIGSVNATRPDPQLAIYAALKAAQRNLVVNLARQHAARGVTINTLSPGLVETERNRWRRQDEAEWAAIQAAANPMARAGTPEEMAGAALLLCSDAGSFITGADLQATGGAHL